MNSKRERNLNKKVPNTSETPLRAVALLFIDLCGSTKMKYELGEETSVKLVQLFTQTVSSLITQFKHGEVVNIMGDGVFCVFENSESVLRFAAHSLEQLMKMGLNVKMGLHVGMPIVVARANKSDDYLGIDVDKASRLCSAAANNSIYCSNEMYEKKMEFIKKTFDCIEIGNLSLKGIPQQKSWMLTLHGDRMLLFSPSVIGFLPSNTQIDKEHNVDILQKSMINDKKNTISMGSYHFSYWVTKDDDEKTPIESLLEQTEVNFNIVVFSQSGPGKNSRSNKATIELFKKLEISHQARFHLTIVNQHSSLTYIFYDIKHSYLESDRFQRMIVGYRGQIFNGSKPFIEFVYPQESPNSFAKLIIENHKKLSAKDASSTD